MTLLFLAALAAQPAPMPKCVVQQVHTPAGKMVQSAPLVRCDKQVLAVAAQQREADVPELRPADHLGELSR